MSFSNSLRAGSPSYRHHSRRWGLVVGLLLLSVPASAFGQYLRIRDICRVKGQEENTLIGVGLVIGLKGTGDTDAPTLRALSRVLESMGYPTGTLNKGEAAADQLKGVKNVALVTVTATIPPEGVRQGEQLNCTLSATGAKSLEGGILLPTPLRGPVPTDQQVYAMAQGPVSLDANGPPTVGVVHDGCRVEQDFSYRFDDGDVITLVIDRHHAGFPTAYEIQEALNGQGGKRRLAEGQSGVKVERGLGENIAQAIDPVNVRVRIPEIYRDHQVDFIATILDTQIALQTHDARVVINRRTGVIIIGDNVMVGRVAVTHKNVTIQTGDDAAKGPLFEIDQTADSSKTRLRALVDALNALKVDPQSIIDIIVSLERSGDIYGRLVVD